MHSREVRVGGGIGFRVREHILLYDRLGTWVEKGLHRFSEVKCEIESAEHLAADMGSYSCFNFQYLSWYLA